MIAKVIVDISASGTDKVFDYKCDGTIIPGMRVEVPFGNRSIVGIVLEIAEISDYDEAKLKEVKRAIDKNAILPEDCIKLALFLTKKYFVRIADALRLFLPSEVRKGKVKELQENFVTISDEKLAAEHLAKLKKNAHAQRDLIEYLFESKIENRAKIAKLFGASATKSLLNAKVIEIKSVIKTRNPYKNLEIKENEKPVLTVQQKDAIKKIESENKTYLLHGVTGSGKTEVYMTLMEHSIEKGKTGIMLVPEISLTPQMLSVFKSRFGDIIVLLHSGLSAGEKHDEWKKIQDGKAKIVIGARSAIFAPLKNLGIIVVDEEHDSSYTSDNNPRYSAIEVAKKRRELSGGTLVLGSATPSLESYHKAIKGEYELVEMPDRVNQKALPQIEIIDMAAEFANGNTGIFSKELEQAVKDALENKKQVMIFINRRGYTSFQMCKACGFVAKCPACDVSLVYHKAENQLKCHYCNNRFKVFTKCPECGSEEIKQGSTGTQKVVEEIKRLFPTAKVSRMDNDTTRTKDSHLSILSDFKEHKTEILVGTQMIAKGHDFPQVTLVGIIDADVSLHQSSYAAAEKTFELITQVSGRAGRGKDEGRILLQTFSPKHYVYRMAKSYDYIGFYKKEANLREVTKYPPFAEIIRILIRSKDEEVAKKWTMEYYEKVKELQKLKSAEFFHLSVMRSPVSKIQNEFRFQILMRLTLENTVKNDLHEIAEKLANSKVSCFVETNPQNLS